VARSATGASVGDAWAVRRAVRDPGGDVQQPVVQLLWWPVFTVQDQYTGPGENVDSGEDGSELRGVDPRRGTGTGQRRCPCQCGSGPQPVLAQRSRRRWTRSCAHPSSRRLRTSWVREWVCACHQHLAISSAKPRKALPWVASFICIK
jgi:hypothetical protein